MAGTIREIAERAGVSRGTVDRALNKRGRIDKEVAERIFQIADEIGYVPKKEKTAVKKESVKIGIVTQLSRSSFMIPIRKGLEDAQKELKKRGIGFVMEECVTVSEEEQLALLGVAVSGPQFPFNVKAGTLLNFLEDRVVAINGVTKVTADDVNVVVALSHGSGDERHDHHGTQEQGQEFLHAGYLPFKYLSLRHTQPQKP